MHGIMHVAAREHVGERVADEFADAQLALRGAALMIGALLAWHLMVSCREHAGRSWLHASSMALEQPGIDRAKLRLPGDSLAIVSWTIARRSAYSVRWIVSTR